MVKIKIASGSQKKEINHQKSSIWTYEEKIPNFICDEIIKEFDTLQNYNKGVVGTDGRELKSVRNVYLKKVPKSHWLNGFIHYFGVDSNCENFNYKIDYLGQVDFLKYTEGMFYKLHCDVSPIVSCPSHNRKLTIIIQLSDESDYVGGDIEIFGNFLEKYKITKKKGSIIVFPSNLPHCVKKIKKGVRYSLVGWMTGPPFS